MKEGQELDSLVGYQFQRANLLFMAAAEERLREFGVSPARFSALLLIRDNPGCTQSALGNALAVNRSSAMKITNHLQELGFVSREQSEDARANALRLTPMGEKALSQMIAAVREVDTAVLSSLSADERAEFLRLLHKVRSA